MADNSPTVVVGCKLPNGHIIQVNKERVTLNGAKTSGILGGYGMTVVNADFFAQWAKENAKSPLLLNGVIFGQAKEANAKAQAADTKEIRTGLEPLAQNNKEAVSGVSQPVQLDPGQAIEKFNPKA